MAKKYRGKDILEELETKKMSPVIAVAIFLCVVTILSVFTTIGLKLLNDHTDIEIPWIEKKEKDPVKIQSSRDQMDLVVPKLRENNEPKEVAGAELNLTEITSNSVGFIITFSLKAIEEEYATVEVKQITLDGFYYTTTFAVSDRLDYDSDGRRLLTKDQQATINKFTIQKNELDAIGMFGFNEIRIIYDIFTPSGEELNKEYFLRVNNDLDIVNERKGTLLIDTKDNVQVSYYKTIAADDATYIYFDFKNANKQDIKIYIHSLYINNKLYDMSSFKSISHRLAQEAIFIKIPTKDIPRVNTMKVRFFLVEENKKGEKSFYITEEYQRAY